MGLLVEVHVPLTSGADLGWIERVEQFLQDREAEGTLGAEGGDGEEVGSAYVFDLYDADLSVLLEVASRLALLPGIPTGAVAVVTTTDRESCGTGERVELPLPRRRRHHLHRMVATQPARDGDWSTTSAEVHLAGWTSQRVRDVLDRPESALLLGQAWVSVRRVDPRVRGAGEQWEVRRQDGHVVVLTVVEDESRQHRRLEQVPGLADMDVAYSFDLWPTRTGTYLTTALHLRTEAGFVVDEDWDWPRDAVVDWAARISWALHHGLPVAEVPDTEPLGLLSPAEPQEVRFIWTEELPHPVEQVWNVIYEPEHSWAPYGQVIRTDREPPDLRGLGEVQAVRFADGTVDRSVITEFEEHALLTWASLMQDEPSWARHLLEPWIDGTRLTLDTTVVMHAPSLHRDARQVMAPIFDNIREGLARGGGL